MEQPTVSHTTAVPASQEPGSNPTCTGETPTTITFEDPSKPSRYWFYPAQLELYLPSGSCLHQQQAWNITPALSHSSICLPGGLPKPETCLLGGSIQLRTLRSTNNMTPSEPSSPNTASPGYLNTPEEKDCDCKSHLAKMIEAFKKDINNFLKEIQENPTNKLEALKEKTNPLKKYRKIQLKW